MDNEELHSRLCEILLKLVPVLDCNDLRDLAAGCGIPVSDWYGSPLLVSESVAAVETIEWERKAA